jgi:hypothetical protein
MRHEIRAYESLSVEHLTVVFEATDPALLVAAIERFDGEVVQAAAAS